MELVDVSGKAQTQSLRQRRDLCPCNVKQCVKRYVQPPREKSFAPKRTYNPPANPLESHTTYHASYLDMDRGQRRLCRSQAVRPAPALEKSLDKFTGDTTTKLSYKPVWAVVKARPIFPRQRSMTGSGQMESLTTIRRDFGPKYIDRPEIIVPCGNIRISKGRLENRTTANLSYACPGPVEPTVNFRPVRVYSSPRVPLPSETTHKLSYQPVTLGERDICPWQEKREYKYVKPVPVGGCLQSYYLLVYWLDIRAPVTKMCEKTTYSESFLKNSRPRMEKPFFPVTMNILPYGAKFAGRTIYKESYLESNTERVEPIIPPNSMNVAQGRISSDTTNKLSFQPVTSEKRMPILPKSRMMLGDGPMESETTNRRDFMAKAALRPEPVIPCSNIQTPETTLDDGTTMRLSYMNPGPVKVAQSFKPLAEYQRPADKIDFDTINKLSYQEWNVALEREKKAWMKKAEYQPPTDPMCADTVYHMSFPAPGHYVEKSPVIDDSRCVPATLE